MKKSFDGQGDGALRWLDVILMVREMSSTRTFLGGGTDGWSGYQSMSKIDPLPEFSHLDFLNHPSGSLAMHYFIIFFLDVTFILDFFLLLFP